MRKKLTFPKARSTESMYNIIPKRRKNTPKPTSPTPIPVTDEMNVIKHTAF